MFDAEVPTFHLEKVVRTRCDEPEDFSGPLELVLLLLSKNKLEIRDIRISELLNQYLSYLEKMQELDLDIASEFVQMASHLMYIKTKILLAGEKQVEELESLVASLEQLKAREGLTNVRAVLPALAEIMDDGLRRHTKAPEPLPEQDTTEYVDLYTPDELLAVVAPFLLHGTVRHESEQAFRAAVPRPIVYGVREKGRQILRLLREKEELTLSGLLGICKGRSEIVATFLAVLELSAGGILRVTRSEDDFLVDAVSAVEEG